MTSSSWEREKALFLAALELPTGERAAWVAAQTASNDASNDASNAALREAVLSLLAAHEETDDFLETPAVSLTEPTPTLARVGPYKLVREIGRGGMGTVYLATRDDGEFQHEVAIKLVKRGMDTDAILARFRHERQILAGLHHPNIARLLDGGTTEDGLPYFVMEYVAGQPVREYAERAALTTAQRLTLFRTICDAVEHAHRNLVVHRDIKSSNILVTAQGVPKLLDFGIAKLLDATHDEGATATPTVAALTPEYASPEQLRGEAVTTATDVYSLGVLLFELLTGQRPYELRGRRLEELAQQVHTESPPRPSDVMRAKSTAVAHTLRGDLDTIILMAMHREPSRRYASVAQYAEDIERYQQGLAVRAQRDSVRYRASKFARRHRAAIAAAAALLISLVGGLAASVWQARRADTERARAERRFAEVRSLATSFLFDIHDAIRTLPGATPARALLIRRGLASLDGLAREAQGDTALQRDLAIAYQRIGEVQGNSYGANLGDTEGALRSYRTAIALLDAVHASESTDMATRTAFVESLRGLAAMQNVSGNVSESAQLLERALTLQRAVVATPSTDTYTHRAHRVLLANVLQELADARGGAGLSNVGDTPGALAAYREAIALREALLREQPADVEARAGLASLQLTYGSLAWSLQDSSGAALLRDGVARLETIVVMYPDDAVRRNELLSGYGRWRVPLVDAGRYAEAIAIDHKVLATLQRMVADDPKNALLQRNLSVSYNNLARDLRASGQPIEAVANHRRSLAISEQLRRADSASIEHARDIAFTEDVLAEALADARMWPDALAMYHRAIASQRRLQRLEAADPSHGDDLAFLYAGLGAAHRATGALELAAQAYQQAVPLAESGVARPDSPPRARRTLAVVYAGLAALHGQRGACPEAAAWQAKAETEWRTLEGHHALTATDVANRARAQRAGGRCPA
jgi:non-specific serine/threonine protein kinase/serine/threonine-protein kinase